MTGTQLLSRVLPIQTKVRTTENITTMQLVYFESKGLVCRFYYCDACYFSEFESLLTDLCDDYIFDLQYLLKSEDVAKHIYVEDVYLGTEIMQKHYNCSHLEVHDTSNLCEEYQEQKRGKLGVLIYAENSYITTDYVEMLLLGKLSTFSTGVEKAVILNYGTTYADVQLLIQDYRNNIINRGLYSLSNQLVPETDFQVNDFFHMDIIDIQKNPKSNDIYMFLGTTYQNERSYGDAWGVYQDYSDEVYSDYYQVVLTLYFPFDVTVLTPYDTPSLRSMRFTREDIKKCKAPLCVISKTEIECEDEDKYNYDNLIGYKDVLRLYQGTNFYDFLISFYELSKTHNN